MIRCYINKKNLIELNPFAHISIPYNVHTHTPINARGATQGSVSRLTCRLEELGIKALTLQLPHDPPTKPTDPGALGLSLNNCAYLLGQIRLGVLRVVQL